MSDKFLELEFEQLQRNRIYQQLVKWVSGALEEYIKRCARDTDENEWRKNQGRVAALTFVLERMTDPVKFMGTTSKEAPKKE